MSIEMPSQSSATEASPNKHQSESSKKDKSSHGEKKRKRDGDDAEKSKSKKHKADKSASQSSVAELENDLTHTPKKHKSRKLASQSSAAEEQSSQLSTPNKHKHKSPKSKRSGSNPSTPKENSPFHLQTVSLYLGLAPISQRAPVEGLCAEHISPLILTYYPPFDGVLLSFSNPRISEHPFGDDGSSTLLYNIDEYAVSWAWLTADFLIFKPEKGALLEGYVNLQNEGHLGVVCWNLFNASIERQRLPEDWKWVGVEDEEMGGVDEMGETYAENGIGYWMDGEGNKVDEMVKFRVKDIETSHDRERGFLSIEGTMLDEEAEKDLAYAEKEKTAPTDKFGRRVRGPNALGATSLGVPKEPDNMMDGKPSKPRKHYKD